MAIATVDEEILDREAGILDRPWKINLVRLATRDYLRYKVQVRTGLLPYDQLVEGSRQMLQILFDRVTASPGSSLRTDPLSVTSVTSAAPSSLTTTTLATPTASPATSTTPTISTSPGGPTTPTISGPSIPDIPGITPPSLLPPLSPRPTNPGPSVSPW
jgi:hypothetical protein